MIETKAPDGYQLNSSQIVFVVSEQKGDRNTVIYNSKEVEKIGRIIAEYGSNLRGKARRNWGRELA
ncbi:MAG: SpaA isopeptide-forming pilin-related protein [Eisenbergiella sp.]